MTIPLFIISVLCYTISQLVQHGKAVLNNPEHFFGAASWRNKYKLPFESAPKNWYYKLFRIVHKERFPGSTTIFVTFTDGYHLMQSFFKIFLCMAIAFHKPFFNWYLDSIIFWLIFGIVFSIAYRLFSRQPQRGKE